MFVREKFGPKVHVFVCVNDREDCARSCCKRVGGEEVASALKEWIARENLRDCVWVSRSRCLGFCNDVGATVVIYPQQKWFMQVTPGDVSLVQKEVAGLL